VAQPEYQEDQHAQTGRDTERGQNGVLPDQVRHKRHREQEHGEREARGEMSVNAAWLMATTLAADLSA
jgi:hypothetical protein